MSDFNFFPLIGSFYKLKNIAVMVYSFYLLSKVWELAHNEMVLLSEKPMFEL